MGTVHGTVASIRSVRCRMAFTDPDDPRALWPVPGTAVAVDITRAERWESTGDDWQDFQGYLIELQRADFQPAPPGTDEY